MKLKSIKAIYLYPPGIPHHALSKNSMFYRGLSNSSRDIENKVSNEVKQQKFNEIQYLQTLISSKLYVIAK